MPLPTVQLTDISVSYVEHGPTDGPLVVIVHGFPDSPHSWDPLASDLADVGYRVVAPFQRGYAPTDIPPPGSTSQAGQLGRDLADLIEALGSAGPASLIGHDWGALAVYGAAALSPRRVGAVVGMSIPPSLLAHELFTYDQAKRSFYIWLFQLPVDDFISADDLRFLDGIWEDWTEPATATDAALEAAKTCLRGEGRLTAALGYYRALFAADPDLQTEQTAAETVPSQPFLYLHGRHDGCIALSLSDHVAAREIVEDANHFIHLDRPEQTSRRILDFLGPPAARK